MFLVTHTDSFLTANDNMRFDDELLKQLEQGNIPYFFRSYTWQKPGITHPKSVSVPVTLHRVDHAPRTTGGGIVFHSPGDTVFSMGFLLDDSRLQGTFKEKLSVISDWFGDYLATEGFVTTRELSAEGPLNRHYCLAYPNPFERYYNGQKAIAFAMKRLKQVFMVQGIVHRESGFVYFGEFESEFGEFFTAGLGMRIPRS